MDEHKRWRLRPEIDGPHRRRQHPADWAVLALWCAAAIVVIVVGLVLG